jgi:hypothetical protein
MPLPVSLFLLNAYEQTGEEAVSDRSRINTAGQRAQGRAADGREGSALRMLGINPRQPDLAAGGRNWAGSGVLGGGQRLVAAYHQRARQRRQPRSGQGSSQATRARQRCPRSERGRGRARPEQGQWWPDPELRSIPCWNRRKKTTMGLEFCTEQTGEKWKLPE